MALTREILMEMRRMFPLIAKIHLAKDEEGLYTLFFTKRLQNADKLLGPAVHNYLASKIPLISVHEVNEAAMRKLKSKPRQQIKRDPKWL